jgi:enoyl-CoA hydratase
MRMALLAERIPAAQALDWGLIYRVVPAGALDDEVDALARRLATGAPRALAATKRAVNGATLHQLEAALDRETAGQLELLASADFREGAAAFAAKRPPRFTGA